MVVLQRSLLKRVSSILHKCNLQNLVFFLAKAAYFAVEHFMVGLRNSQHWVKISMFSISCERSVASTDGLVVVAIRVASIAVMKL